MNEPCVACGRCPVRIVRPSGSPTGKGRFRDYDDGCIADLPGVMFACCGHGDIRKAYLVLGRSEDRYLAHWDDPPLAEGKPKVKGLAALAKMRELGGNPWRPA